MAPSKIRKPRPVRGRLPGQDAHNRQKTGPKKPWSRAEEIAGRVGRFVDSLNPFD